MIPAITSPVWTRLVTGEKELQSSSLAINMVLHNCQVRYQLDPSKLDELTVNAREIFLKYEKILASELAQLGS